MTAGNLQLMKLIDAGLSVKEAAEALGLDPDSASLALESVNQPLKILTVEELVSKYRPAAVETLASIMLHGENESARVKAAQIILSGEGQLPEIQATRVREMMNKVLSISDSYKNKIIDITSDSSSSTEPPSQQEEEEVNGLCMAGAV